VRDYETYFGRTRDARVGKLVIWLKNIGLLILFIQIEMTKAERLLSYSLRSLISFTPLASASTVGINEDDGSYDVKEKGLLNDEGAWCWREGCESKPTIHGLQMGLILVVLFCPRLSQVNQNDAKDI
jgi:hypothetical protein